MDWQENRPDVQTVGTIHIKFEIVLFHWRTLSQVWSRPNLDLANLKNSKSLSDGVTAKVLQTISLGRSDGVSVLKLSLANEIIGVMLSSFIDRQK